MTIQRRLFILLIALAVIQIVYYYSQLPDTVASHFTNDGEANGWSAKDTFFALYIGLVALFAATFLLLPRYLGRVPTTWISMPNKEYWLAPERQPETLAYISGQMLIMGSAVMAFLICIIQIVIQANIDGSHRSFSGTMWILLGGYLAFSIVWTTRFIARFSKTDPMR